MLARIEDFVDHHQADEIEYDGFPFWRVLLCQPGREHKTADTLDDLAGIKVYAPSFKRQIAKSGGRRQSLTCAVMPAYLFVPTSMLEAHRKRDFIEVTYTAGGRKRTVLLRCPSIDDLLEFARVRSLKDEVGKPIVVTKAHIERIRLIEAKLNLPPERKGVLFKVGQKVRLVDDLYWGWQGPIVEVCSERRIGIEVDAFGRKTILWVTADEIEAI